MDRVTPWRGLRLVMNYKTGPSKLLTRADFRQVCLDAGFIAAEAWIRLSAFS